MHEFFSETTFEAVECLRAETLLGYIKCNVASVTRNLDTLFAVSREEATTKYPGPHVLLLQISELFEERGKPKRLRKTEKASLVTSWKSQRVLRLFH